MASRRSTLSEPELTYVLWTLTPLAVVAIVVRVVIRLRSRIVSWDDVFVGFSALCFLTLSIVLTLSATTGRRQKAILLHWLGEVLSSVGLAAGRISVVVLLLSVVRLSDPKMHVRRMILYAVPVVVAAAAAIIWSILVIAQCSPTESLWDDKVAGRCIKPGVVWLLATFAGAFDTLGDASLAMIPMPALLQPGAQKMLLAVITGLNLLTTVCSGVKTVHLARLIRRSDDQPLWPTPAISAWATAEFFAMMVCGSVMALRMTSRRHSRTSRTLNDFGDLTHMRITTRTTIERARFSPNDSFDRLVGVRVDTEYDVRRETRSGSFFYDDHHMTTMTGLGTNKNSQ